MIRATGLVAAVALFAASLAGCSSMQTVVEKNPDANFDDYKTWNWYPGERAITGDPRVDLDEDANAYIRSTIERHLAGRGYQLAGYAPELYIDYHVTLSDQVNSQVVNNYYGESYYPDMQLNLPGIQDTYSMSWEEGALLILIFDAKSKNLVWRGLVRTKVDTQGPRKEAREKVDKAIKKLLDDLPKT